MKLTLFVPLPSEFSDASYGIIGKRSVKKYHLPSEKLNVFNHFRQKLACENFCQPKISAPVGHDVASSAEQ